MIMWFLKYLKLNIFLLRCCCDSLFSKSVTNLTISFSIIPLVDRQHTDLPTGSHIGSFWWVVVVFIIGRAAYHYYKEEIEEPDSPDVSSDSSDSIDPNDLVVSIMTDPIDTEKNRTDPSSFESITAWFYAKLSAWTHYTEIWQLLASVDKLFLSIVGLGLIGVILGFAFPLYTLIKYGPVCDMGPFLNKLLYGLVCFGVASGWGVIFASFGYAVYIVITFFLA